MTPTKAPSGFQVGTSAEGHRVISRRRVGPPLFMGFFYVFFIVWTLGWVAMGVFLTNRAATTRAVPPWLAALWWAAGIVVLRYVFGYAWWRLSSVTTYTFRDDTLLIENVWLTRRTSRRTVNKRDVRAVRQVCEGAPGGDVGALSWGLELECPRKYKLLTREEFETSAWLGPLVAQWAGVGYESAEEPEATGD